MRGSFPPIRRSASRRATVALAFGALLVACGEAPPGAAPQAPADLAREIEKAISVASPLDRLPLLASLLQGLDAGSVDAVVGAYAKHDPPATEYELLVEAWVRFDPRGALGYALKILNEEARVASLKAAFRGWATYDPQAAREALEGSRAMRRGIPQKMQAALVSGWVRSPVAGVEEYLLADTNPASDAILSPAIWEVFRRDGAEGLRRWSEELITRSSDHIQRRRLFRKTVRRLTFADPAVASPWALEHWGEDYATDGPRIVAETWVETDPEAAFEWLRTEAPEASREDAVRMAFRFWIFLERARALAWLEERGDEPVYHPAIVAGAHSISKSEPRRGADLCDRLPTGKANVDCVTVVGKEWYGRDPVAAGAWLEESDLSVERREKVREWGLRKPARRRPPDAPAGGDRARDEKS